MESLKIINTLLIEEKPEKVIVLSISEKRKSSGTIDSYLGRKDLDTLKNHFKEDQNIRMIGYSDTIIRMSKELNIPTEKITKTGKIPKIIIENIEKYQPSHVIIHQSNKSKIDKILSGSVKENICKKVDCRILVLI